MQLLRSLFLFLPLAAQIACQSPGTRGLIARPWQQGMALGGSESGDALYIVLRPESDWSGALHFDIPRHREYMGFEHDWPRMNTMPEWFTVDLKQKYEVHDLARGTKKTYTGRQLHRGLRLKIKAGEERLLRIR